MPTLSLNDVGNPSRKCEVQSGVGFIFFYNGFLSLYAMYNNYIDSFMKNGKS